MIVLVYGIQADAPGYCLSLLLCDRIRHERYPDVHLVI